MYIQPFTQNGTKYAKVCYSHWKNGKDQKTYVTLGKIIDEGNHIYKNRKQGYIHYDPGSDTITQIDPEEYGLMQARDPVKSGTVVFGDVWMLDQFVRMDGLLPAVQAIPVDTGTVLTIVYFYLLNQLAVCHAEDWYYASYVQFMYPNAHIKGRRVSEEFVKIGSEESWSSFFRTYKVYLDSLPGNSSKILIDSTGLPNSIHFPLTGISNHNGKISREMRLIYVSEEETGIPVFMRYVSGTIQDVSTVETTINEMKENGYPATTAILDAGYYSDEDIEVLMNSKIDFIIRMKPNKVEFKELFHKHRQDLENPDNLVQFNSRMVFIKKEELQLPKNRKGYSYLCLDIEQRAVEDLSLIEKLDSKGLSNEDLFWKEEGLGAFAILSTINLPIEEILPMYYKRQEIEQAFDLGKNYADLVPLRVHNRETLRGHLLVTFIGNAILNRIQYLLDKNKKKRDKKLNIISFFQNAGYHYCDVYEDKFIVTEADSKANEGYRLIGVNPPHTIPRG